MSAKLARCIRLLTAFQRRGTLANRDVRELLDCDEQTASRDLRSLMDAGVPLQRMGTGAGVHYELDRQWRRNGVHLSMGDAMSLHFGRKLLSFLEGTVFPEWLDELREKLDLGTDERTLARESRFAKKLVFLSEPYRPYRAHDDTLDVLLKGLLDEREVHARYTSRRGVRALQLQPLALVIYRRALYIIASSARHPHVLRLPVERFQGVELGSAFDYPEGFEPAELLMSTFGIFDDNAEPEEVRLRFRADVSDLVRSRHWHPSQQFKDGPDGSVDLVLTTSGPELGRLALEWGDRVEVLSPPNLRKRVARELASALQQYGEVRDREPSAESDDDVDAT
jgi:predicted DNA-binding transcriptional regulator YafY